MTVVSVLSEAPQWPQERRNAPRAVVPDPWIDIDAYRAWWYPRFCPTRRCAACGIKHMTMRTVLDDKGNKVRKAMKVQLHHLRYRAEMRASDWLPLCRRHHIGDVHRIHRALHGEDGDRTEINPSENWRYGLEHPQLAVITWRVVRRVRRRSWRRYVGLVPRFCWEHSTP